MPNSTTTVGSCVSYAKTFPEIAPVVQVSSGGSSLQPSLTIATDVMIEMVAQVFNWKWNRFKLPLFYTNSWQQDYALNVVNLGWLEHGTFIDINNTQMPKPIWPMEVVKDLEITSAQYGVPGQACWFPNDQLTYGTWAASTVFGQLLGINASPSNPLMQVVDAFGNFWAVTNNLNATVTTGLTNPFATNLNPVFPTPTAPSTVATTVSDGTVVWVAINPKGQGIRCNPLPPQQGVIYQFNLIGQWRPGAFVNGPFTSFNQLIEPIPDDFAKYFRDGFVALAYAHSQDKGVRGKADDMKTNWIASLTKARMAGDRERDNEGFFPSQGLLAQPYQIYPGPAYPYPLPQG